MKRLSLLLFLETRAVDHVGAVASAHMNADDFADAEAMNAEGLIEFGRIAAGSIFKRKSIAAHKTSTHWVRLSVMAFEIVATERRARAKRGWKSRNYQTTAEKRAYGSADEEREAELDAREDQKAAPGYAGSTSPLDAADFHEGSK